MQNGIITDNLTSPVRAIAQPKMLKGWSPGRPASRTDKNF